MKKIYKNLTSLALTAVISVSIAATSYAQEYFDENVILNHEHSEEYQELGYIPDAGLGTPEVFSSSDRSFASIFYQYPDGSYFSKTGKACTCHSAYSNNCDPYVDNCECIHFENAIQCAGFARKVYQEVHDHSLPSSFTQKNMYFESGKQAKELFNHNNTSPEATYLRVSTNESLEKKYEHSLIIVFSSDSKVVVYHANYGGPCKVRYESYTWDNFVKAFPYLYKYTN